MHILIPYMECVIKFNVSSTIIIVLHFQKVTQKIEKPHYLINGEFDQKGV